MAGGRAKASSALSFLEEQIFTPMLRKAFTRLDEGMDATKVKRFQYEGAIVEGPVEPDYTERREAAKEVLKLGDYYPDRLDVHLGGEALTIVLKGFDEGRV